MAMTFDQTKTLSLLVEVYSPHRRGALPDRFLEQRDTARVVAGPQKVINAQDSTARASGWLRCWPWFSTKISRKY
jgi:hypothetical protein